MIDVMKEYPSSFLVEDIIQSSLTITGTIKKLRSKDQS